jgi:hypothetical protein
MERTIQEPNPQTKSRRSARGKNLFLAVLLVLAVTGGWVLKEGLPWVRGIQAYIYAFPLIMMDLTREAGTAVTVPGEFTAPLNQFSVMTHYPDASFRAVARTGRA